jgi:alkylmercury lyase
VQRVDPPGAVVSLVRPPHKLANVRRELCDLGHFFASREVASDWLATNPGGHLSSVEEDFQLRREMVERLGWSRPGSSRA